ncbi:DUF349 domain-containing protein [Cyclobacterium sp. 1_MG-2023]|uniref:DUF349 domain-containing protein n=1 Tax=Cyclobacterium sp. 1_MG-2023 TaxID=3062681 RepID=UPI0026E1A8DA|nr:DUF349 domain-containing protein [Cyclobacterium sp. 1_MG-2023]MDO6437126.1 DUF349 domain-containing protein [Cyclobacterium sp. 1_MG-2023]
MDNEKEMSENADKVTEELTNSQKSGEEASTEKQETPSSDVTGESSPTTEQENVADTSATSKVTEEETVAEEQKETKEETSSDKTEEPVTSNETSPAAKEESEESEEEEEEFDFHNYTKPQLIKVLKDFVHEQNFVRRDGLVQEIKNQYDEYYLKEQEQALDQFLKDGGEKDGFVYRGTDEDREFFASYQLFKERKHQQFKDLEKSKEKNANDKNLILDQLRAIVDGEETTNSIETIKKIQDEWKKIGPVPHSQNKNLWASYNALMDRFYDNRSIYFELKELDRKKNLDSKLDLCSKAEALSKVEDVKEAIKSLNDLHEEFKHIGPVPREDQEALWQRFKSASDAVYNKRKAYYDSQREVFKANQVLKEKLIEKLEEFKSFKAEKIRDWNTKTKEILALQKEWEAIGPVPREAGKEINKTFWGLFKQFFHHKNLFFKELDEIRQHNKEKAEKLIESAETYLDSTDWKNSSNELIQLQKQWKELGPMPEKFRDDLYNRFKKACDTFFDNRRNANKENNKAFEENLVAKERVCQEILDAAKDEDQTSSENLEKLIQQYNEIGFVPRKSMKDISNKFNTAVNEYVSKLELEGESKDDFLFRLNLNKLQADPNSNKVLNKKEHGIRRQITDLENNITLWRNNLEFFAASKTADKLKDQFEEKIEKAEQEVDKLKKKLSIIREF